MPELTETEQRATQSGWTPEAQFKGDPSKWIPAEEWNERTDNIMPILKATNKKLEQKNQTLEQQLATIQKDVNKMVKASVAVERQAYEEALEEIKTAKANAISHGDGETFNKLEEEEDKLKKKAPGAKGTGDGDGSGELDNSTKFKVWLAKNPWYDGDKNPEATGFAMMLGEKLAMEKMSVDDQFVEIERQVKEKFPHLFGKRNQGTEDPTGDEDPDKGGSGGTYTRASLPADAKEQLKKSMDRIKLLKSKTMDEDSLNKYMKVKEKNWIKEYNEDI